MKTAGSIEAIHANFADFQKKQETIYTQIKNSSSEILSSGIHPAIGNKHVDSYLILYKHSDHIAQAVHEFSLKIAHIVPATIYLPDMVHTTLSIVPVDYTEKDSISLHKALKSVALRKSFTVNLSSWLLAQDAVIAAGEANQDFFDTADEIIKQAAKDGLKLQYPKMTHITTARFTQSITDLNTLQELEKCVDEQAPLGLSHIQSIEIAYIRHTQDGFEVLERFGQELQ